MPRGARPAGYASLFRPTKSRLTNHLVRNRIFSIENDILKSREVRLERELLVTGIGGQGVQLATQVLARALTLEGRYVMSLGTYGGTMRGGNTDASLVFADRPISSPPIVASAWSGLIMHHRFWEGTRARLRPQAVLV